MTAKFIDGKLIASQIRESVKSEIIQITKNNRPAPGLAVILVGHDPASEIYVKNKHKACDDVGIKSYVHHLDASVTEPVLLSLIDRLNNDDKIDGIDRKSVV